MGTLHPSPGVRRLARKTDGSPLQGAGVKNKCSYSTNLPFAFIACTFVHTKPSLYQLLPIKFAQVVSLPTCIRNAPLQVASETSTIPSDEFRGICKSPHANTRIRHQIRLKIDSLPHTFQFLIQYNPTPSLNNPHTNTFWVRLRNAIPYYTVKVTLCLCSIRHQALMTYP